MHDPEILLIPIIFLAGVFRGVTGFGGPLIMMPVFVLFYPAASAAATILLTDLTSNFGLLRNSIAMASYRTALPAICGALALMPFGSYVIVNSEKYVVNFLIYCVCTFASYLFLRGVRLKRHFHIQELVIGGGMAGATMGATGLGVGIVPIMGASPEHPSVIRANLILFAAVCTAALIVLLFVRGAIGTDELVHAGLAIAFYMPGVAVGVRIYSKVNQEALRLTAAIGLGFISLYGVVSSAMQYLV